MKNFILLNRYPTCGTTLRFFICFLLLQPSSTFTQVQGELGRPFITNYSPQEYKAHAQNWAIIKDKRGVIYFGNSIGLLEYDGVNWRLLSLPNQSVVRSFDISEDGILYYGSSGEFGYMLTDDKGHHKVISLDSLVPESKKNFNEIWSVHVNGNKIYFQARERIFRLTRLSEALNVPLEDQWEIKSWDPPSEDMFMYSFLLDNTYFVHQRGKGLMKMEQEELVLLPGTEVFANERLQVMLPLHEENATDKRYLLAPFYSGLFEYDGQTLKPFSRDNNVEDFMRDNLIYKGTLTAGKQIVLASVDKGAAILSPTGKLVHIIDRAAGLQDNTVYSIYSDPNSNGELWLGLDKGIAKLETNSPLTIFNEQSGLTSTVISIHRHQGRLYLGTSVGVFYLDPEDGNIKPLNFAGDQTFSLMSFGDQLLLPSEGLYATKGSEVHAIRESAGGDFQSCSIHRSKLDSNRIFVGLIDGIASLRFENGQWIDEGKYSEIHESIWSIIEMEGGKLWLGTASQGALSLEYTLNGSVIKDIKVKRYGVDHGLPEGGIKVFQLNKQLFLISKEGIYLKKKQEDYFYRDKTFEVVSMGGDHNEYSFTEDDKGNIWVSFGKECAVLEPQEDGTYRVNKTPFLRLSESNIFSILPETGGITWLPTGDGLVRYDNTLKKNYQTDFPALIRNVFTEEDSLLYAGNGDPGQFTVSLPFKYNNLRFEFAAPFYDMEERTLYQSYLEGYDKHWTNRSPKTEREYTNLPAGTYTFHARAQNIYGHTSEQASFSFRILTPWYQSWWAKILYVLAGIGLVYGIVRWRTRQLKSQSEELEQAVQDRTKALSQRLNELATVNQVSRALVSEIHLEDLFQLVGEELRKLFQANIVYIAMYDKATDMIHFPYEYGDKTPSRKFGKGLTEKIIISNEPLLVNRSMDRQHQNLQTLQIGLVSKSYLGVPIPEGKDVIGVLSVQSTQQENRFKQEDMRLLNTIAANVSVAIHNARLFEETKKAKALAEEANEAKSNFLSTVSHELRTPLTSVLGFAKIIRKRLDEKLFPLIPQKDKRVEKTIKQVQDNLNVVVEEGERLTNLINEVLDLAKIEAGKFEWNMESLDLKEVTERAIAATSSLFDLKPKLDLQVEFDDSLPKVLGDKDRLIQVLINLISNAVKFTDTGMIKVKGSNEGTEIVLSVSDTGSGIAQEDLDKVFQKFKQVGDTLTDRPKGTGLGLPICKEIIEQHGGKIWVNSDLKKGSTFTFSLPVQDLKDQALKSLNLDLLVQQLKQQTSELPPVSNGHTQTILIVDDEAHIRELLHQELSEIGYETLQASNGKDALEIVRDTLPDLIILDVMMPEMNGFDLAAILKNDPATKDIPILILSIMKDKERGLKLGVDRYLTKPIDTEALFREIDCLLQQGKSTKKVMIVDENESTVRTVSEVLANHGYQVVEANGQNLLKKAKSSNPDVIILNSLLTESNEDIKTIKFEKGMEHVLFLVYH